MNSRSIGKDNFFLVGEITGLDAALGIEDIPDKMESVASRVSTTARNSALMDMEDATALTGLSEKPCSAWSRILSNQAVVLAINTDPNNTKAAWVNIDASLHKTGESLTFIYPNDAAQIGTKASVEYRTGFQFEGLTDGLTMRTSIFQKTGRPF